MNFPFQFIHLVMLKRLVSCTLASQVSSYGEKHLLQEGESLQSQHTAGWNIGVGSSALSSFHTLADFLHALTNADSDGRIIVSKRTTTSLEEYKERYLKSVMLDVEKVFAEVLELIEHNPNFLDVSLVLGT